MTAAPITTTEPSARVDALLLLVNRLGGGALIAALIREARRSWPEQAFHLEFTRSSGPPPGWWLLKGADRDRAADTSVHLATGFAIQLDDDSFSTRRRTYPTGLIVLNVQGFDVGEATLLVTEDGQVDVAESLAWNAAAEAEERERIAHRLAHPDEIEL